ncbi:MAG: hypothetical protein HQM10_16590 [Candidatus Riflebacteria bacterium]|nr:hypothetical protein [Candidatus Riflebacteria bacterium]
MTESIPVQQENNKVNGDIAGGNIYKNILPEKKSALAKLAESYQRELGSDEEQQCFIGELQDYMKRMPDTEPRDLEQKLVAANRSELIQDAKFLKEKFTKKLYKHAFSPNAQNIFVHILASINACFRLKIKPLIFAGETSRSIDEAIFRNIVEAIYNDVGNSELGVDMDDIHGMLYYLTGNCYINWDK